MIFKRSDIPGEDIKRGMQMVEKRRQLIDETPADSLVYEYGVNRLAKSLHPGTFRAKIINKEKCGIDSCRISFAPIDSFPYFRAGQFITLSKKVNDSFLSRPYSISSSPSKALNGLLEIVVQRKGIFSNYLIDEANVNDEFIVGEPSGDFYYDDIRDKKHILAIAGGSGVTPFMSMMKAIKEGDEDFRLTLLYGIRTRDHSYIDLKEYEDERINIVMVLSDEEVDGYRHGFITSDVLKEYLDDNTSVFMCGPDAMYAYVEKQLEELSYKGHIRKERNSIGDRKVEQLKTFKIKVHIQDELYELDAYNNETIITALEREGIAAVVRCRNGICGFCHSRVISGEYYIENKDDFRRAADKKFNYIHPCSTYPESDMELEVPRFDI